MSEGSQNKNANPKCTRPHNPAYTPNENTDQLIEMAAEQFANLLWKQWLFEKKVMRKKSKAKPNSC